MSKYDKYYQTVDLFGNPYPELIDFFSKLEKKNKVIDIGCGQGRNAIPLAKMGYTVVGIDNSKVGIQQMLSNAEKENLAVSGIVGDFYDLDEFEKFDIIVMDSIFHFYKRNFKKETEYLTKVFISAKKNTIFCLCIDDKKKKIKTLKDTLIQSDIEYMYLVDMKSVYLFYDRETGHTSENKFNLLFIKKV